MAADAQPRWAYWIKGRSWQEVAANPPARLRAAWPKNPSEPLGCWMTHAHPEGGTLCVFPRLSGAACSLDEFGPPRETDDGMIYYPSLVKPTLEFLIKPQNMRGPGEWVSTFEGAQLWIAIAFCTPRRLVLASSGMRTKDPVTEFGALAHDVYDDIRKRDIPGDDPRLARLLYLALRESYTVTEEMAEDWDVLTDRDINPIVEVALGASPKPSAAEVGTSASAAPTTPTSP